MANMTVHQQSRRYQKHNAVNAVCKAFFKGDLTARTVVGVLEITMDALIQIDAVVSNCESTPPQALLELLEYFTISK